MKGHSPGSFFSQDSVANLKGRYSSLLASLHSFSLELESRQFPSQHEREWRFKSIAVSSAVRTLLDGKIEIRPFMYVALSYDHRIIDGREAVTFLKSIKQKVEDPRRLLLDL